MCQKAETALTWLPVAVNDPSLNFVPGVTGYTLLDYL